MELLDIIITALSIVLLILVSVLIISFIVYKFRGKNEVSYLKPGLDESDSLNPFDVIKPNKPQRYKVLNENLHFSKTINQLNRKKLNNRFIVYNFLPVQEVQVSNRKNFTKWSE